MKPRPNGPCPCGSGAKFKRCCRPILDGQPAPAPEALMRSRYTAYTLGRVDHIIDTTHPGGPMWEADREDWAVRIQRFCASHVFVGLDVRSASEENSGRGHVHFRAHLTRDGEDVSFAERSLFLHHDGRWRYHSGEEG